MYAWKFEPVLNNMCSMHWRHVVPIMACLLCHVWMCKVNVVSESTASGTDPLLRLTRYPNLSVSSPVSLPDVTPNSSRIQNCEDKPPLSPNELQKLLYIVGGEDPVRSLGFEIVEKMFEDQLNDMSKACYDLEYLEQVHVCMSSRVYTHVLPQVEKVYYYFNEHRSDYFLNYLKVLVIKIVSKTKFECLDSRLLRQNWLCGDQALANAALANAIKDCMNSMIASTLWELRTEYHKSSWIALY